MADYIIDDVVDPKAPKTVKDLHNEVSKLNSGLEQTDKAAKQLGTDFKNITSLASNVTTATRGLVSGFQAYQSIAALAGVENEDLANTFVKLQAGMALTQSFTGLTKGFNSLLSLLPKARMAMAAFNTTLLANPILLVVAALAALTAAIGVYILTSNRTAEANERLKKSYNEINEEFSDYNDELEYEIRLLKARGEIDNEQERQKRIKAIQDEIDAKTKLQVENRTLLENEIKDYAKRSNSILASIGVVQAANAAYFANQSKDLAQFDKDITSDIAALNQKIIGITNEGIIEIATINRNERDKAKKDLEDFNKKEAAAIQKQAELRTQILEEERQREASLLTGQNRLNFVQEELTLLQFRLEFLDQEYETEQERLAALEEQKQIRAQIFTYTQEEKKLNDEIIEQIDEQNTVYHQGIQEQIELQKQLNAVLYPEENNLTPEQRFQQEKERLLEIANDTEQSYEIRKQAIIDYMQILSEEDKYEKELDDLKKQRQIQSLKDTSSFLSSTSKLIGENSVAGKAIAISAATIDTLAAAVATLRATAGAGPWVSIPAMTTVLTTGAATVKQIASVKVPGFGDIGSGISMESAPLPNIPDRYNPINERYNKLDAREEERFNQSQRVYVLESDISSVQNSVDVVEGETEL